MYCMCFSFEDRSLNSQNITNCILNIPSYDVTSVWNYNKCILGFIPMPTCPFIMTSMNYNWSLDSVAEHSLMTLTFWIILWLLRFFSSEMRAWGNSVCPWKSLYVRIYLCSHSHLEIHLCSMLVPYVLLWLFPLFTDCLCFLSFYVLFCFWLTQSKVSPGNNYMQASHKKSTKIYNGSNAWRFYFILFPECKERVSLFFRLILVKWKKWSCLLFLFLLICFVTRDNDVQETKGGSITMFMVHNFMAFRLKNNVSRSDSTVHKELCVLNWSLLITNILF
jgi:hypothetical protein